MNFYGVSTKKCDLWEMVNEGYSVELVVLGDGLSNLSNQLMEFINHRENHRISVVCLTSYQCPVALKSFCVLMGVWPEDNPGRNRTDNLQISPNH